MLICEVLILENVLELTSFTISYDTIAHLSRANIEIHSIFCQFIAFSFDFGYAY